MQVGSFSSGQQACCQQQDGVTCGISTDFFCGPISQLSQKDINKIKSLTRKTARRKMNKIFQFKLVLLGQAGVGKSNLVLRFVKGEFHENNESTIGGSSPPPLLMRVHGMGS
jgi:hypothetical protein